jgi:hypothetical protein
VAIIHGQFESRFKNYDESDVNQPLSQWGFSGRRPVQRTQEKSQNIDFAGIPVDPHEFLE